MLPRIGIVGLPASGKTTLFNYLTGLDEPVGRYSAVESSATAVVHAPDERLEFLRELQKPEKCTPPSLEFTDTAGLFAEDRLKGESRVLAEVRECDGVAMVVRAFQSKTMPHPEGSVDPRRDLGLLETRLLLADLDVIERRIERLKESIRKPTPKREEEMKELDLLERCRETINSGGQIRDTKMTAEEQKLLRGFAFLTQKPVLVVLNIGEDSAEDEVIPSKFPTLRCPLRLELELFQLPPDEREEFMEEMGVESLHRDELLQLCYRSLNLITFYTVVGKELRAWSLREGSTALEAAGKIHTDIARGFVKAEVVHFNDVKELGSLKHARSAGKFRLEGRDYIVQDGDIITFKFTQ